MLAKLCIKYHLILILKFIQRLRNYNLVYNLNIDFFRQLEIKQLCQVIYIFKYFIISSFTINKFFFNLFIKINLFKVLVVFFFIFE